MYLLLISISLCVTYYFLRWLFPLFFTRSARSGVRSGYASVVLIFCLSLVGYLVTYSINDPEIQNRFLHGFGGGFMALYTCYLATKDIGIIITRLQFLLFSVLVVGNLGIANEILEFILQSVTGISFVTGVFDTWHDLVSNLIGSLIAAAILTPFVGRDKQNIVAGK